MSPSEYAIWLSSVLEATGSRQVPNHLTTTIRENLKTVFKDHIDRSYPEAIQGTLADIHSGKKHEPDHTSVIPPGKVTFRC
jgi:hypothetical protein